MKLRLITALLLWSACGNDHGNTQQPVVENEPADHADSGAKGRDASTGAGEDAATGALDAEVADAAVVVDAGVQPTYPRPAIAQGSLEPACFPLYRQSSYQDQMGCPDTACVPGTMSWTARPTRNPGGFVCGGSECYDGWKFSEINNGRDETQLFMRFSHPIELTTSSEELRAALWQVWGGTDQPESVGFVSEPSLIEQLSNENGRLHVVGWGLVTSTSDTVPTVPHYCGTEAPNVCVVNLCTYGTPDSTLPKAWFHFDVEAQFKLTWTVDP